MANRFPIRALYSHLHHLNSTLKHIASYPPSIPAIAPLLCFPSCLLSSVSSLHPQFLPPLSSALLPTNYSATRSSHSSTEHTESTLHCWSCGERISNTSNLICPSCNAVQKPDPSIDYFQMFGLERKYDLDLKDLEGKYKNLMKKLHPDLLHGKSPEEQANAAYLAAVVTKAYDELVKPVSRATYLGSNLLCNWYGKLKLQGIQVEEEGTVNDPDLIMEVMEIRETLEQTSDRKTLQQLCDTAKVRMDKWIGSFTIAWKEGNRTAAIAALQRMSYFSRVFEDIRWKLL